MPSAANRPAVREVATAVRATITTLGPGLIAPTVMAAMIPSSVVVDCIVCPYRGNAASGVQRLGQRARDVSCRERLDEHLGHADIARAFDQRRSYVAADQNDRDVGPDAA